MREAARLLRNGTAAPPHATRTKLTSGKCFRPLRKADFEVEPGAGLPRTKAHGLRTAILVATASAVHSAACGLRGTCHDRLRPASSRQALVRQFCCLRPGISIDITGDRMTIPQVSVRRQVFWQGTPLMDHDRLFKELLTTFFVEFIDLFFPELAAYLDRDSIEFLDKEVFTDVTHGEKHEADIVAKARFRGKELGFLIHVEPQAGGRRFSRGECSPTSHDSTRSMTCPFIRLQSSPIPRRGSPNRANIGSSFPICRADVQLSCCAIEPPGVARLSGPHEPNCGGTDVEHGDGAG